MERAACWCSTGLWCEALQGFSPPPRWEREPTLVTFDPREPRARRSRSPGVLATARTTPTTEGRDGRMSIRPVLPMVPLFDGRRPRAGIEGAILEIPPNLPR